MIPAPSLGGGVGCWEQLAVTQWRCRRRAESSASMRKTTRMVVCRAALWGTGGIGIPPTLAATSRGTEVRRRHVPCLLQGARLPIMEVLVAEVVCLVAGRLHLCGVCDDLEFT
jgi:hypothetical protein